jgi:cell wall-associated NlpC family hydrolase
MRPLRYLILLLVLASALFVALVRPLPGSASQTTPATTPTKTKHARKHTHRRRHHHVRRPTLGKRVVRYARRFIGVPYSYGGSSPRYGFDCSGFVRYVWGHFGISLPHSSYADMARGRAIPRRYLKPGDLVFFAGGGHVGIYIGGNRVIDAPHSGAVVHISTMTDWYSYAYDGARRIARVAA